MTDKNRFLKMTEQVVQKQGSTSVTLRLLVDQKPVGTFTVYGTGTIEPEPPHDDARTFLAARAAVYLAGVRDGWV